MKNVILMDGMEGRISTVHGTVLCLKTLNVVELGCPASGDAGDFFDTGMHHRVVPGVYQLEYRAGCRAIAFVSMTGTHVWLKNSAGECWHYSGDAKCPRGCRTVGDEFRSIANQWLATVEAGG